MDFTRPTSTPWCIIHFMSSVALFETAVVPRPVLLHVSSMARWRDGFVVTSGDGVWLYDRYGGGQRLPREGVRVRSGPGEGGPLWLEERDGCLLRLESVEETLTGVARLEPGTLNGQFGRLSHDLAAWAPTEEVDMIVGIAQLADLGLLGLVRLREGHETYEVIQVLPPEMSRAFVRLVDPCLATAHGGRVFAAVQHKSGVTVIEFPQGGQVGGRLKGVYSKVTRIVEQAGWYPEPSRGSDRLLWREMQDELARGMELRGLVQTAGEPLVIRSLGHECLKIEPLGCAWNHVIDVPPEVRKVLAISLGDRELAYLSLGKAGAAKKLHVLVLPGKIKP